MTEPLPGLDRLDLRILDALQRDGRISNLRLAKAVGLSPTAVQVRTEIMECHMVAGGFDYLLKTRMADMAAYREFAGTVLWQLPGVRETRTYPVMEEVKNTTRLPI